MEKSYGNKQQRSLRQSSQKKMNFPLHGDDKLENFSLGIFGYYENHKLFYAYDIIHNWSHSHFS